MALENVNSFQVSLPKEFLPLVNEIDKGQNINEKIRFPLAIGLFVGKKITSARAAQLAGMTLTDFIDFLRSLQIPWMEYTEEHFQEDQQTINELNES